MLMPGVYPLLQSFFHPGGHCLVVLVGLPPCFTPSCMVTKDRPRYIVYGSQFLKCDPLDLLESTSYIVIEVILRCCSDLDIRHGCVDLG